jgi:DNA-binding transcriptional MerR regulator
MLRYYDENGLLIPALINQANHYRLYSSDQIETLNRIVFLKEIGLNVAEIKSLLDTWNKDNIKRELLERELDCKRNILKEQEKLLRIKTALLDIKKENLDVNINIVIKSISSYRVIYLRKSVPNYFCEGELWKEFTDCIKREKLNVTDQNESFAIYHDNEYKDNEVDMELCVVTDVKLNHDSKIPCRTTEAVEKAACFMVYGPYENISIAYKEFAYWMEQHPQYKMTGESRQICHKGDWNESNPKDYITELQFPIEICL